MLNNYVLELDLPETHIQTEPAEVAKKLPSAFFSKLDGLVLLIVLLGFGFVFVKGYDLNLPPYEDAAMIMRYSDNLAQGYGIVWNKGEAPVDGATDFLFMVVVAGLIKGGLSAELAVRVLTIAAHLGTILLIYFTLTRLHKINPWISGACAMFLAIGPALAYIQSYFGTPFFAFFAALTWLMALIIVTRKPTTITFVAFAVFALITSLIRPEGLILTGLMLISLWYFLGIKKSLKLTLYFVAVMGVFGGSYFAWRWLYFGYPLPNPYYKKGGGSLYLDSLIFSVNNVLEWLVPLGLVLSVGLFVSQTPLSKRKARFIFIPVVGFTLCWLLLSNEMNYEGRFQYALLPMFLLSWPLLFSQPEKRAKQFQVSIQRAKNGRLLVSSGLIVLLFFIVASGYQYFKYASSPNKPDSKFEVAKILNEYGNKGYTIATSEAGLLPYYSNWKAVDTWGLNDKFISHNGVITEDYLDKYKPEIIMFHDYNSKLASVAVSVPASIKKWWEMVNILKNYASTHGYILAAEFGTDINDTNYYYIKADFAESAEIVSKIRATDYYYFPSGDKTTNFALLQ